MTNIRTNSSSTNKTLSPTPAAAKPPTPAPAATTTTSTAPRNLSDATPIAPTPANLLANTPVTVPVRSDLAKALTDQVRNAQLRGVRDGGGGPVTGGDPQPVVTGEPAPTKPADTTPAADPLIGATINNGVVLDENAEVRAENALTTLGKESNGWRTFKTEFDISRAGDAGTNQLAMGKFADDVGVRPNETARVVYESHARPDDAQTIAAGVSPGSTGVDNFREPEKFGSHRRITLQDAQDSQRTFMAQKDSPERMVVALGPEGARKGLILDPRNAGDQALYKDILRNRTFPPEAESRVRNIREGDMVPPARIPGVNTPTIPTTGATAEYTLNGEYNLQKEFKGENAKVFMGPGATMAFEGKLKQVENSPVATLEVKGTITAKGVLSGGASVDAGRASGSFSTAQGQRASLAYSVQVPANQIEAIKHGTGDTFPNPLNPKSLPVGSAVTIRNEDFQRVDGEAKVRLWGGGKDAPSAGVRAGASLDQSNATLMQIERPSPNIARVRVANVDTSAENIGLGGYATGTNDVGLTGGVNVDRSLAFQSGKYVDINLNSAAGQKLYDQVLTTGRIPDKVSREAGAVTSESSIKYEHANKFGMTMSGSAGNASGSGGASTTLSQRNAGITESTRNGVTTREVLEDYGEGAAKLSTTVGEGGKEKLQNLSLTFAHADNVPVLMDKVGRRGQAGEQTLVLDEGNVTRMQTAAVIALRENPRLAQMEPGLSELANASSAIEAGQALQRIHVQPGSIKFNTFNTLGKYLPKD